MSLPLLLMALACGPGDSGASDETGTETGASADSSDTSDTADTSDSSSTSDGTDTSGGTDTSDTGEPDPCDPNPCTEPPAPECDGDILLEYTEGSCTADSGVAVCDYAPSMIDCTLQGHSCEAGACTGLLPPAPGEVIFVELMIDPDVISDFTGEWFELENLADGPRVLSGCTLADLGINNDDHLITTDEPLVIEAGSLMVMAKSTNPAENGGIEGVAYAFGDFFSLTNTGDTAVLRCDDQVIDEVSYEPNAWPYDKATAMQLDPLVKDALANDDPLNWCAATTYYDAEMINTGTPGVPNDPCMMP